jgi:hypothetical protein
MTIQNPIPHIDQENATFENSLNARRVINVSNLITGSYDYILLDPPNLPTTVTYKSGGSSGATVATLNIAYSGSDIVSITRA